MSIGVALLQVATEVANAIVPGLDAASVHGGKCSGAECLLVSSPSDGTQSSREESGRQILEYNWNGSQCGACIFVLWRCMKAGEWLRLCIVL